MIVHQHGQLRSAIFITFSGNCREALTFYHGCFGGQLKFETFEEELAGFPELPVVSASLVTKRIIIKGSDLVHNEGRKLGNYISIFLYCNDVEERNELIKKLAFNKKNAVVSGYGNQKLIEIIDFFDVRWLLGV